jgi:hypothetical protein
MRNTDGLKLHGLGAHMQPFLVVGLQLQYVDVLIGAEQIMLKSEMF